MVQSLPRVEQHLSTLGFIKKVVVQFGLVKPDDPVDEADLCAYLAEDVLPPDQQIEYEGKY